MTSSNNHSIMKEEVAHLAFLNWQKDGCPSGRDLDYWVEAESQLKATKHLMVEENSTNPVSERNTVSKTAKTKTRASRKATARKELAG